MTAGVATFVMFVSFGAYAQPVKIAASDAVANDRFGSSQSVGGGSGSVAIEGDILVAGVPRKDGSAGAAYVYVRSGGGWIEEQKLVASDAAANAFFGFSVAISGETIVVGAYNAGQAYVFVRDTPTTWMEQAKLSSGGTIGLGWSVDIDQDTVVTGAPFSAGSFGSAHVFTRSGAIWTEQLPSLSASDGAGGNKFGNDVAIDGSTLVVTDASFPGNAYLFNLSGGVWNEDTKLMPVSAVVAADFGNAVSISGDTVAVAAFRDRPGPNDGAVYVFRGSGATWPQEAKLTRFDFIDPAGFSDGANFGLSVSIDGNGLVVGQTFDGGPPFLAGSAFLFTRSGTIWSFEEHVLAPAADRQPADIFGEDVALGGTTLVVAAPGDDEAGAEAGAGYVFSNLNIPAAKTPEELLQDLIDKLDGFDLAKLGNSLSQKLANAQSDLEAGRISNAVNKLQSFLNEVEAQRGKALTDGQATQLTDCALEIIGLLTV
jgi:hypothetical protein